MESFKTLKGERLATLAAMVTVVTAAVPTLLMEPGPLSFAGYVTCVVSFAAAMLWVMTRNHKRGDDTPRRVSLYFVVQIVLLGVADWLGGGRGSTWLMAMPLLGHTASYVKEPDRRRSGILWTLALFAVVCWMKVIGFGWIGLAIWIGPIAGAFTFVIAFTWMTVDANEKRLQVETLLGQLAKANHLLLEQTERLDVLSRESERTRVARELHDSLGHGLTALAVQLEVIHALEDRNAPKAQQAVERARTLAQAALQDVRESVRTLRTPSSPRPLHERLSDLVRLEEGTALTVAFETLGEPAALATDKEQALYRAAQEGLTNARKHSGATTVSLILNYTNPLSVRLEVRDTGGSKEGPTAGTGFGISGLRERLAVWGGAVEAGPVAGGGFRLCVEVPR